jgi:hypothetical protein
VFNSTTFNAAIHSTLDTAPTDEKLRAKIMTLPTHMNKNRRALKVWVDPAAFSKDTTKTSPWIGANAWNKPNASPTKHKQKDHTKTAIVSQDFPPTPTKKSDLDKLQQEIEQLKKIMETSTTQTEKQEDNMEKMRQQITAEVKASIPETADIHTLTNTITHQVEKLVTQQTGKLSQDITATQVKLTEQQKLQEESEQKLEEKLNNLALKTASNAEKTKTMGQRISDFETQTNKRMIALRQSTEANTRHITELAHTTSNVSLRYKKVFGGPEPFTPLRVAAPRCMKIIVQNWGVVRG